MNLEKMRMIKNQCFENIEKEAAPLSKKIIDFIGNHRTVTITTENGKEEMKCDIIFEGYVCELENNQPSETKRFPVQKLLEM